MRRYHNAPVYLTVFFLLYLITVPGFSTEQIVYEITGDVNDHYYGHSVAIDGDYAIVGARSYNNNKGAAYIYHQSAGTWTHVKTLTVTGASGGDSFGFSVAIDGEFVIVGAEYERAAYVYYRNQDGADQWGQVGAKLESLDSVSGDDFGDCVDISYPYAIVGAPYRTIGGHTAHGRAYIYEWNGDSWLEQVVAHPNDDDDENQDHFGSAVGVDGTVAAIGAERDDGQFARGSVYVFERSNPQSWLQTQWIHPGISVAHFGSSIELDGTSMIVGAKAENGTVGAAYVYTYSSTWSQQDQLLASDGAAITQQFGWSTSISGDYAIVGTYNGEKAYSYLRTGSNWSETSIIAASDGESGDQFGFAVAISGNYALVGAPDWDKPSDPVDNYDGAAYFFHSLDDLSLPVTLSAFQAVQEPQGVVLTWITESETNNLGFILDRDEGGKQWTSIGHYATDVSLMGQGSVSYATQYEFTDGTAEPGKTYRYRLKSADLGGSEEVLDIITIALKALPEKTSLHQPFPNPFNPSTKITYSLAESEPVTLYVVNLLGKRINTLLDNETQAAGTYHLFWNGRDESGRLMESGHYMLILQAGRETRVQKAILMR